MQLKFIFGLCFFSLIIVAAGCTSQSSTQTNGSGSSSTAAHHDMNSHTQGVNERGDQVMGFDHQKTTHHFRLLPDGGAIEVEANDAADTASRDQIRQHLGHIAQMFSAGNFEAPMLIHGQEPDGVSTMRNLKGDIKYQFEETEKGGRDRITTGNSEALTAIHNFLRFQIKDHQTGDPLEVTKAI